MPPENDPVVIVSAARTPIGGFLGELASLTAPELGAHAAAAAIAEAGIAPEDIDECTFGCVLPAGLGQAPARQAALTAGVPERVPATTVNKICGSGMKAVMLAHDALLVGNGHVMLAGGFESMSNAPYLLPRARQGLRLGHADVKDHMFLDGLEDAYEPGRLMGWFAEQTATHYGFTRGAQDAFAIRSLERARDAAATGRFDAEIAPITLTSRTGDTTIVADEQPLKAKFEKIPSLKPAFAADGTVTAANSSSISDGAAALVLMRESEAMLRGLTPRARILAHSSYAQEPAWFSTAPIRVIEKLLTRLGIRADEIGLYEISEAFAVVTMAAIEELRLDAARVNVNGGACALGHPIGASGARIIVTLLNAMEQRDEELGIAALCIGGGEATAVALERPR
ncbi:MAG: acetyl-CoA C-acyltransferase [Gammaproteobacteria bacterium]|nr:MAG: acetyl-CoA C-acyltransferase [Gammaproteobacteria bacterium]